MLRGATTRAPERRCLRQCPHPPWGHLNSTATYLRDDLSIIASGESVPETSYYPSFAVLLKRRPRESAGTERWFPNSRGRCAVLADATQLTQRRRLSCEISVPV